MLLAQLIVFSIPHLIATVDINQKKEQTEIHILI